MSLSAILKEMENNKVNAEMDITLGNPETYNGRIGLKRAATETLKRLRSQYGSELMGTTAFIVVTGASRDSFTDIASSDTFGCFSTDPDSFYKELVSRINPTLFGRENTRYLFNIVSNILEDKKMEIGIRQSASIAFSEKYNSGVTSPEELVSLVKRAVNDQVGSEIVGINAIHSVVDMAINKKHTAPVTPVILSTSDEKFAQDLAKNLKRLTPKVFLIVAGKASKELSKVNGAVSVKTVSEETVGEALSTIRNKVL